MAFTPQQEVGGDQAGNWTGTTRSDRSHPGGRTSAGDALGWRPKNEWHGIKHRRPRGKSQKSDATSFRESQQQRQTLQHLKLLRDFQRERGEW